MLKGKLAKTRTTDRKIREGNTFLILALMGESRYDGEGVFGALDINERDSRTLMRLLV